MQHILGMGMGVYCLIHHFQRHEYTSTATATIAMKEEVETKPVTMYNFFQDYIQLQTITQNINFRKKRTSCIFS